MKYGGNPAMKALENIRSVGVVDDDRIFTSIAQHKLKQLFPHSDIIVTNDPDGEMEWLQKVDVLFLDINMGKTSAWEFMERHVGLLSHLHLILCSSSIDRNDHERAKTIQLVNGFVIKPMTDENVRAAMAGEWPKRV